LINGQLHDSLRNKNYNVRDDQQHYNDQWTRLTTDWQINDAVSASNELYYLKARRRWQNAENYNFDTATQQLSRSGYFGIGHQQEQVGDRQTFTFKHSLFGLDSQTVTGVDYNRIRFQLNSNSPFNDVAQRSSLGSVSPATGLFRKRQAVPRPVRQHHQTDVSVRRKPHTTERALVAGDRRAVTMYRWIATTWSTTARATRP
jgi:iron complex outermembrane receptor protein